MKYELVLIFSPNTTEAEAKEKVIANAEKDGFKVSDVEVWGKKHMSYEINKQREGMYASALIAGSNKVISLYNRFKVDESIMRSLIIKHQDVGVVAKAT